MPFYVNTEQRLVIERPRGSIAQPGEFFVDGDTVREIQLVNGQVLTAEQLKILREWVTSSKGSPGTEVPRGGLVTGSPGGSGARALAAASFAEIIGWLLALAGAVLGVAVAVQEEYDGFSGSSHPYVWAGIAIGVAAIFQASLVIMISAYIQWRIRTTESAI